MRVEAALVLPAGWKATPEVAAVTIGAKQDGTAGFTMTVPAGWDRARPRVAFAADLVADGQYLGEIAEAVVDIT